MKKINILITIITAAAMLCACGSDTRKEDTMEEITAGMSEEDKASFASGIKTADSSSEVTPVADAESGNSATDDIISGTLDASDAQGSDSASAAPDAQDSNNGPGIEERYPVDISTTRADVKYGEYTHGTYYSETCGLERGYSILLPAGYSTGKKYPVLYLLHGIFGNEYSFSSDPGNKIKEIVGNMAADGMIEETIIVCPDMYATSDPDQKPGFDAESVLPYDNFINDLVNDLMPYIESEYSVLTGRENTYLAGFSMGGRETIYITLQRPELFGYVCAISAAPGIVATKDKFMTHTGQLEESEVRFAENAVTPNIFILCCGTNDSVVGKYPKSYHELLETNGTDHIWYEISGADHDNNAIKSGLYNLFKMISYDKPNT